MVVNFVDNILTKWVAFPLIFGWWYFTFKDTVLQMEIIFKIESSLKDQIVGQGEIMLHSSCIIYSEGSREKKFHNDIITVNILLKTHKKFM